MSAFEKSEQSPAPEQVSVSVRQPCCKSDRRPERQHHWVNDAHRKSICDQPKKQRPRRECQTKGAFKVAILLIGQSEMFRDSDRRVGERLAIHVIDRRGKQKQTANPPFPAVRSNGRTRAHPFHDFPSQRITRSTKFTTSSVNVAKRASPFPAEASSGEPM